MPDTDTFEAVHLVQRERGLLPLYMLSDAMEERGAPTVTAAAVRRGRYAQMRYAYPPLPYTRGVALSGDANGRGLVDNTRSFADDEYPREAEDTMGGEGDGATTIEDYAHETNQGGHGNGGMSEEDFENFYASSPLGVFIDVFS